MRPVKCAAAKARFYALAHVLRMIVPIPMIHPTMSGVMSAEAPVLHILNAFVNISDIRM